MIYIPLYATKGLYLTSILYGTFLAMCVIGLLQWWTTWHAQERASGAELTEAAA